MNKTTRKHFYILILSCIIHVSSFSQCNISGKVNDNQNAAVSFAPIALVNANDSNIFKGTLTDVNGKYCFNEIKSGTYLIKVSAVGFAETFSEKFKYDSAAIFSVPLLLMKQANVNLNEVSVTAIKKTMEFRDGNIIVNIEDSPLAVGNSVYELLERMPGVIIDNGVISIEGNAGAKVFVDDRILQMSGQQLINMLRSMRSSSVEKIEIIKNPPARYDAAGTAGIINIKTKKLKITGFSGNVNYTFSQGFYSTNNPGLSLNYKGKKFALFSSVDANEGRLRHVDNIKKQITYNSVTTVFDQQSRDYDINHFLTARLGADWYINKKNTIGVKMEYLPGYALRSKPGDNYISDNSLGYTHLNFNRIIPNTWWYRDYNVNAEHLFDTLGTKLTFSTDYYSPYTDVYTGLYENRFLDNQGNETAPASVFKSDNTINLNILSSKLDFEKKFSKTLSLDAGVKNAQTDISTDFIMQNRDNSTGTYFVDTNFTNKYTYHEVITAGYFTLRNSWKKLNASFGLRGENSNIQTQSVTNNIKYHPEYFNLFPTASLNYNSSDNHTFQISYNRRIYRPDYEMYNPYKSFVNVLTSSIGNPFILPSYGHTINVGYVYKKTVYNSLSFTKLENGFLGYPVQNNLNKETVFSVGNIQNCINIKYSLYVNVDIQKWWTFTFNAGSLYRAVSGPINGADYNSSTISFNCYTNNQFLIAKNTKIELGGFYMSPYAIAINYFKSRMGLHVGIKKTLLKDKMDLSIGMYDIFFTNVNRSTINFQDQNIETFQSYDSRRLNISISYNFGNIKVQQREVVAGEQEKQRMGK